MEETWQAQLCDFPVENVEGCLLCPGVAGEHDERWYRYLGLVEPYDVLHCQQCGLRWLSPRPDAEGYRKLYSSDLYFGGKGASPADYQHEAKSRIGYWRARVKRAASMRGAGDRQMSFLDYGAATGEFVRVAHDEGYACVGMELSADARAMAKKINHVSLLSLEQLKELNGVDFDVIHMNHVLEHMPNPLSHLQWCSTHLKDGGLLVVEVPQQFDNDLDRLRRLVHVGGKRSHFDAYSLHHTYFFTSRTLTALFETAGFKIKHLATFNPNKTPLWPPAFTNWVLRPALHAADVLHRGGNIIEVYAASA